VNDRSPAPSFRTLFDGHFSYVWSVLRRLGVRDEDVEDLVHEVFLNVYRHLPDYDPTLPVKPWLFGFAFRVASDDRRRARRRREVIGTEVVPAEPARSAHDALVRAEERSLLMRALQEIALDRRAVLVLHEWDECTIPEVARSLRIPLNTAYTRLRLGRADLAAAVKRLTVQRPP
jgi:RNA polymerase sigma-70 factor (ECF subfamily)